MSPSTIDIGRVLAETFVVRAEHHPTLGSTNDRARACVGDGGPTPLLVVADEQTRGRGRGTNRWWTGPGSLAFSLLLAPETTPSDPRRRPLVALAAGVAVADAARPLVDRLPVGLHWPNDVFAGDRKLSGVLVEVPAEGSHIVGIGVNTNNSVADAPADIRDRAVTLYDLTGRRHDQTAVLIVILQHFAQALDQARTCPDALVGRANAMCQQIGRTLALRSGEESVTGRCVGIAGDGALVLDTSDGRREFRGGMLG
jgi:BirA family transcriptional regulator, biotin operon repressor / biotin---[acetyl-CoA-carboxylase] ligase